MEKKRKINTREIASDAMNAGLLGISLGMRGRRGHVESYFASGREIK